MGQPQLFRPTGVPRDRFSGHRQGRTIRGKPRFCGDSFGHAFTTSHPSFRLTPQLELTEETGRVQARGPSLGTFYAKACPEDRPGPILFVQTVGDLANYYPHECARAGRRRGILQGHSWPAAAKLFSRASFTLRGSTFF